MKLSNLVFGTGEVDGEEWTSINPLGQPSAADQVREMEIDARERSLAQREVDLEKKLKEVQERNEKLASKQYELEKREAALTQKEKALGLLEELTSTVLDDG